MGLVGPPLWESVAIRHNAGTDAVNRNGNIMKRFILCLTLLAVPILEANALAQARHLDTCWPAFSYDGKPVTEGWLVFRNDCGRLATRNVAV